MATCETGCFRKQRGLPLSSYKFAPTDRDTVCRIVSKPGNLEGFHWLVLQSLCDMTYLCPTYKWTWHYTIGRQNVHIPSISNLAL